MLKIETNTFTFNELEKISDTFLGSMAEIHYCSYCGEKALRDDIGSTHNHRWDEEIIYHCNCEQATYEKELKDQLSKLNSEVWKLEDTIKRLNKLTDNDIVNQMKYENEINKLKKQYKIK